MVQLKSQNDTTHREGHKMNPTKQLYDTLNRAYAHYNTHLFQDKLPHCVITLSNKGRRSYGYYVRGKFANNKDNTQLSDEICLNPVHFETKDFQETMQTLVHEMVHLWQFNHGKPPSRAYHDKEFAAKMFEVGLQPTSDGTPTGATTGPHMLDICIPDGLFDVATKALAADGLALDWYDRTYSVLGASPAAKPKPGSATASEEAEESAKPLKKPSSKIKYSCPDGHINAWAKPNAKLVCGECSQQLKREDEDE
jgi:predicted SprT family Zn-dependent metalloprotease